MSIKTDKQALEIIYNQIEELERQAQIYINRLAEQVIKENLNERRQFIRSA